MFGTRRVPNRAVALLVFVSCIFLYFVANTSHKTASITGLAAESNSQGNLQKTSSKRTNVDLVIVEEHHEVLEYWFDAANKGKIPKSGNVLLHIDAHSDMAPPELVENYPAFRWPKNIREVTAMMQSNDVFIQAAAMSGLFKKIIWVWPSWDEETHEADEFSRQVGGGLTVFDDGKETTFCECEYSTKAPTKSACQFVNRTKFSEDQDYDGSKIDPKYCNIKGNVFYQEIVDYNALNKLKLGQLVQEGESLLLDIDEDFFGCVLRGHSLVNSGIPWVVVEEMDELLNEIFCPRLTAHEEVANDFMQVILAFVTKHCKSSEEAAVACVTPRNPKSREFASDVKRAMIAYRAKGIFCPMSIDVRNKRIEMLVEMFVQLEVRQIRACAELGFCMQTSPRSYNSNGFQLCHGANEPNTTIVTQHTPGENELTLRLQRLQRMLKAEKYPTPEMVTLCRSVRDGYTSVTYFEDIEENVLKAIRESRADVTFNTIYDINLLGGEKGWPSRQRAAHLAKTTTKIKNVKS